MVSKAVPECVPKVSATEGDSMAVVGGWVELAQCSQAGFEHLDLGGGRASKTIRKRHPGVRFPSVGKGQRLWHNGATWPPHRTDLSPISQRSTAYVPSPFCR